MKGKEEDENHDGFKHTVLINCWIVCSLVALGGQLENVCLTTLTQLSHNPHSHVCETHMYKTHTHVSGGCVGVEWGLCVYHLPLASFFPLFIYLFFWSYDSGLWGEKNICRPRGDLHKTMICLKINKKEKESK